MKIGVTGITGRMGKTIASLVLQDDLLELSSALIRKDVGLEGQDLGEFLGFEKNNSKMVSDINQFIQGCDAIIDFSAPALSLEIAAKCAEAKKVLICGTRKGVKEKVSNLDTRHLPKEKVSNLDTRHLPINLF